jgi:hypothetical protein
MALVQFFTVEITATNAHGYSAVQLIPFQVEDMPPSVIGSVPDIEVDHLRPLLIPLATENFFQSNLRDDLLTVSVGLWDQRPLVLPGDDPAEIANSTIRPQDAGDALFDLPAFLTYNATTQQLSGTPQDNDFGQYEIAVRAFDSMDRPAEVCALILTYEVDFKIVSLRLFCVVSDNMCFVAYITYYGLNKTTTI